jgi:hypothetical protein
VQVYSPLVTDTRCAHTKMKLSTSLSVLAIAVGQSYRALAASYDDIPEIQIYGQHFFYVNNGSQLYVLHPTSLS